MGDVAAIAKGLSEAEAFAVCLTPGPEKMPSEAGVIAYYANNGWSGNKYAVFAKRRSDLIRRIDGGGQNGCHSYRQTDLGLLVREHLEGGR